MKVPSSRRLTRSCTCSLLQSTPLAGAEGSLYALGGLSEGGFGEKAQQRGVDLLLRHPHHRGQGNAPALELGLGHVIGLVCEACRPRYRHPVPGSLLTTITITTTVWWFLNSTLMNCLPEVDGLST